MIRAGSLLARSEDFSTNAKHPIDDPQHVYIDSVPVGSVILEGEFAGQTQDPWGNQRAIFSATTSVDRKEFGPN